MSTTSQKENKVRVIILRHGETELNRKQFIQGWTDSQLTKDAIVLTKNKAKSLVGYDINHGYTSDLNRSYHTCSIIFSELNIPIENINQVSLLREFNYGYFELKPERYLTEEVIRWIKKNVGFLDKLMLKFSKDKKFKSRTIINALAALDHQYFPNNPNPVMNDKTHALYMNKNIEELKSLLNNHPEETIFVISHGHYMSSLLDLMFPKQTIIPSRIANLSGFEFEYSIDNQTFSNLKQA